MKQLLVPCLLLTLGGPAHADILPRRSIETILRVGYALQHIEELPALAPSDPVTAAMVENAAGQYRNGFFHTSLSAGAATDLDVPGAAMASATAAWDLPICRVVGANASGLAGYEVTSYSLGGTACLPSPITTIQVGYTHRDNVRTTLLDAPVVMTDRRDDELVDVDLRLYRWHGTHNEVAVMPMAVHADVTKSAEVGPRAVILDFEMSPAHWQRRGKERYRFVQVKGRFHGEDELDTNIVTISPLIVDGIRLGPAVTVGFDVGYQNGGVLMEKMTLLERKGSRMCKSTGHRISLRGLTT